MANYANASTLPCVVLKLPHDRIASYDFIAFDMATHRPVISA